LPKQTQRHKCDIKKLRRLAHREDLTLWSLDECHFQQHGSRCVMWIPPEDKDPVLPHAPTRKSIALFGAINLRSGQLVTMFATPFNADSFAVFLRQVARHQDRRRRNLLILDNAAYHRQPTVPQSLTLDHLPPYSPELNPIERVWKLLRRLRIHNVYFETLERLTEEVTAQLVEWAIPNPVLRRLCCIT
jgi:transposase